jgi:hypothetical protein
MEKGSTYAQVRDQSAGYVPENVEILTGKRVPDWIGSMAQACPDAAQRGKCIVEVLRKRDYEKPPEVPFGKSGGLPFAAFLGHAGDAGHFEITDKAAAIMASQGITWSAGALAILKDASRDPDFYEWGNSLAHAQTRNDPVTGFVDESHRAVASSEFITWSANLLQKAVDACRAGKPSDALYLTGYALHGIQDLVFHKGITNAEHSFRDFVEDGHLDDNGNPAYQDNMSRATSASATMLIGFRQSLQSTVPSCWSQMTSLPEEQKVSNSDRERLLGKTGKDFGIFPYLEYKQLSIKVRDAKDDHTPDDKLFITPRWITSVNDESINRYIADILSSVKK